MASAGRKKIEKKGRCPIHPPVGKEIGKRRGGGEVEE